MLKTVHACAQMYTLTHTHTHTYTHIFIYICERMRTHAYTHTCKCTHMHRHALSLSLSLITKMCDLPWICHVSGRGGSTGNLSTSIPHSIPFIWHRGRRRMRWWAAVHFGFLKTHHQPTEVVQAFQSRLKQLTQFHCWSQCPPPSSTPNYTSTTQISNSSSLILETWAWRGTCSAKDDWSTWTKQINDINLPIKAATGQNETKTQYCYEWKDRFGKQHNIGLFDLYVLVTELHPEKLLHLRFEKRYETTSILWQKGTHLSHPSPPLHYTRQFNTFCHSSPPFTLLIFVFHLFW